MRVLVTGATGFVGRWLSRELQSAGHDVSAAPSSNELDIADHAGVRALVEEARPDVIAHLAAVASAADAARDPGRALLTTVGGTVAITEAARARPVPPPLLVVSSAAVYAPPVEGAAALDENAPLAPPGPYGLLKLAQDAVAAEAARRHDLPMVIVRPFNHVGPGQPPATAVASFAAQVGAVRRGETETLTVGSIEVERDIGDVRDYVVAYRLILEALAEGRLGRPLDVFNVATGTAVRLRSIVDELCRLAGVEPRVVVDPGLVRPDDAARIVGDARLLRRTIAWRPRIELRDTLADVLATYPAPRPAGRG